MRYVVRIYFCAFFIWLGRALGCQKSELSHGSEAADPKNFLSSNHEELEVSAGTWFRRRSSAQLNKRLVALALKQELYSQDDDTLTYRFLLDARATIEVNYFF